MIVINVDKVIAEAEQERNYVPEIRIISTDIIDQTDETNDDEVVELLSDATSKAHADAEHSKSLKDPARCSLLLHHHI